MPSEDDSDIERLDGVRGDRAAVERLGGDVPMLDVELEGVRLTSSESPIEEQLDGETAVLEANSSADSAVRFPVDLHVGTAGIR